MLLLARRFLPMSVLLICFIAACAGQRNTLGLPQPPAGLENDALQILPALSDLPRHASGGGGAMVNGSEYADGLPNQNVAVNAATGVFSPAATDPAALSDMAYAVYQLDLSPIMPASPISLDWATAPAAGDLYVALSHWSSNRWKWFTSASVSEISVSQMSSFVDGSGRCFIAVFLKGDSQAILNGASVPEAVGVQGDWWCFGKDQTGNRRSPFLGPDSSNVRWTFPTGHGIVSSAVFDTEGTIYTASYDGFLYAINPDGSEKWKYQININPGVQSTPTVAPDGTIYIGSFDHKLYAIDSAGDFLWDFETGAEVVSSAMIADDGTIYIASFDGFVYAINPNGQEEWKFNTLSPVTGSVSLAADGTVYVGTESEILANPSFYALNPSDGSVKWSVMIGDRVLSDPAIADDGTIYFGCEDGSLYARKPADGTEEWTFTATDGAISSSPAVGSDGTIYFGSNWETDDDFGGSFYAVNANGTLKWSHDMGDFVTGSAAVDSAGNTYFGAYDGVFYSYDIDGNFRWSFQTVGSDDGIEIAGSASIGPDGTVYVGTVGHNVYAFGTAQ
jgi:outer membrane protein assembly factor BamB